MSSASAAADIAAALREILARGLDLSAETLRFIDSTFSHPSAAELAAVLADDTAPERDCLLELLFSPDESLQVELEERLGRLRGAPPASEEVIASLAAAPLPVAFRFPDGRGALEVSLTAPLARGLVLGLRIDRELPGCIADGIAAHVPGRCGRHLRVMMRNACFEFTPAAREFLCALIPKLDVHAEGGRESVAFALELLAEHGASENVFEALAARKRWLAKALHHSQRLREQLNQSNVETLLSQGQRLTWVDETRARRQMDFIDRICLAAFGGIVPVDADGWGQTVDIDGVSNAADLMRRLP